MNGGVVEHKLSIEVSRRIYFDEAEVTPRALLGWWGTTRARLA